MTELLTVVGVLVIVSGLGVAVWSFIDTRKRYYKEYLRRKRNAGD